MESPTPPSDREANIYYYGLPSCPKLVARSSTHVWEDPCRLDRTTYPGPTNTYKTLRPAGGDPLLHRLWNDATSSLRIQIIEAVSAVDWRAVDILRLGWVGEFHTTLLVSVKPESLSWSQAHPLTLRCKGILEAHGISNVHCEMRESIVTSCGSALSRNKSATVVDMPSDMPSGFQLSSASDTDMRERCVDLSDCLGSRISMKDDDTRFGTKGIYLSLKRSNTQDEPKLVALTCRHVVVNHESEDLKTYCHQESQTPREVIQIDQPEYTSSLELHEHFAKGHRKHAKELRDCGNSEAAARYDRIVDEDEDLLTKMRPYVASSLRTFGMLLYSPEFAIAPAQREAPGCGPWLRDWALIELLPSRHQTPLGTLMNNVFVGRVDSLLSIVNKNTRGWRGFSRGRVPLTPTGTLPLANDVVPESELYDAAQYTDDDKPTMLVAQYGAGGELTVGIGNTLKSLVRRNETLDRGTEGYSEEWAITTLTSIGDSQRAFSFKGDSGSCIWDLQTQRPAGIIMAGVHHPAPNGNDDVTYAQPLEHLLGDIKGHGFDVSLI